MEATSQGTSILITCFLYSCLPPYAIFLSYTDLQIASVGFTERSNRLVFNETIKFSTALCTELSDSFKLKGTAVQDVVKNMLKITLCVIASASFGFDVDWSNKDAIPVRLPNSSTHKLILMLVKLRMIVVLLYLF